MDTLALWAAQLLVFLAVTIGGAVAPEKESTTPAVAQQPPAVELLARAEGRAPLISPHNEAW